MKNLSQIHIRTNQNRWTPGRKEIDHKEHGQIVADIKSLLRFCEMSYAELAAEAGIDRHRILNTISSNQSYLTLSEKNHIFDLLAVALVIDMRAQEEYMAEIDDELAFCESLIALAKQGDCLATDCEKGSEAYERICRLYHSLRDENGQKLWREFINTRETLRRILSQKQQTISSEQLASFGQIFQSALQRTRLSIQARQAEIRDWQSCAQARREQIPNYLAQPNGVKTA